MPESYTNSKILNRQSPSKSTLHTMAKIFRILWTMIPGTFSSIACLPVCQQQKSIPSPQCGTVPPGPQSSTWWWADYIGLLIIIERQHFVLTGTFTSVNTDLKFLHTMLLPKRPSKNLQNALHTVITSYTALLLIRDSLPGKGSALLLLLLLLLESVGLTMFPIVLKLLTWGNG